ncbi:MAG: hypothetical protein J5712_00205, partial [Lachnospiraceae bacterium]|nr:hypothetical protein [Lachnospiraceae bacterium]
EEEGFEVTEEDYEKKFEEYFFDYYGFESKEEVLEAITQEEIDDIVHKSVLQEKAESVIMDSAVINK